MSKPVIAAFDFDGTLSEGVSGLRFFRQLLGPARYHGWFWVRHFPSLLCYGLRWRHEASLDRINRAIFAGRRASEIEAASEIFVRDTLPRHLVPETMAQLRAHRAQGHRCILVSRGYEIYLRSWARSEGIADVSATRLEVGRDGRLTGRMPEPSCDGAEKRERLLRMIGDRHGCELHVYGDGPGDFAMLAEADRAFVRGRGGFQPWRAEGRGA
ncbi:MAG TPA: HAD-IB family hydrolase [Opitutaceae bacterium]|nr:HAD-IB family hydrolase [Opitutaceae bacterium]